MSVARFIADQRAKHRVPHTITCVLLGVSVSWFYKWITRADTTDGLHTDTDRRRAQLDTAVAAAFKAAKGLHGSPRLIADLRDLGWPKFPDLVKRDFTAVAPNRKWVGDMTEIPTESGQKLYLATVIDLYSRRLLGAAMGLHPDADLACAAIKMAVTARGGRQAIWRDEESERVLFHTDRGSTYTANAFTKLCRQLGIRQSMGRVGSCFDNAAAEAFFSSLEWEVLSRNRFGDTIHAQAVVIDWCYTFYNHQRRHSAADGLSPVNYEIRESKTKPEAA